MSQELTVQSRSSREVSCFSNIQAFEDAQRMAKVFSESTLVPKDFQKNIGNCVIALDMANRMGANPLMVMQNLYIVHGKPSWSSTFIISALNTCGKFKPLRFDITGKENSDDRSCVAWTVETGVDVPIDIRTLAQAEERNLPIIKGPKVSIKMAKDEGWYDKNGSKWKTMPDVMLNYRAASFFGKLYAPEILMGMQTREEIEDMVDVTPRNNTALKEAFMSNAEEQKVEVTEDGEVIVKNPLGDIIAPKVPKPPKVETVTLNIVGEGLLQFPTEIDTVKLMQSLQDMTPLDEKEFIRLNKKILPKVAEIMRGDSKAHSADNLLKILNKE